MSWRRTLFSAYNRTITMAERCAIVHCQLCSQFWVGMAMFTSVAGPSACWPAHAQFPIITNRLVGLGRGVGAAPRSSWSWFMVRGSETGPCVRCQLFLCPINTGSGCALTTMLPSNTPALTCSGLAQLYHGANTLYTTLYSFPILGLSVCNP